MEKSIFQYIFTRNINFFTCAVFALPQTCRAGHPAGSPMGFRHKKTALSQRKAPRERTRTARDDGGGNRRRAQAPANRKTCVERAYAAPRPTLPTGSAPWSACSEKNGPHCRRQPGESQWNPEKKTTKIDRLQPSKIVGFHASDFSRKLLGEKRPDRALSAGDFRAFFQKVGQTPYANQRSYSKIATTECRSVPRAGAVRKQTRSPWGGQGRYLWRNQRISAFC